MWPIGISAATCHRFQSQNRLGKNVGRRDDMDGPQGETLPPQSLESEQAVLGILLLFNEAWDRLLDLKAEHFHSSDHAQIFRAISALIEGNRPADVLTVADQLQRSGKLEAVGGIPYLHSLAESMPSVVNVRVYADIVIDRSIIRRTISTLHQAQTLLGGSKGRNGRELLDQVQGMVMELAESGNDTFGGLNHIRNGLSRVMIKLDMLAQRKDQSDVIGVPTGFGVLDSQLAGMQAGDLIVLAARPSMGKTAMLTNIAEHVAVYEKLPVGIFTMEMSEDQIAMRILAALTGVNSQRLRVGRLNNKDWDYLNGGLAKLNDAPIFLDEQGQMTVTGIRARARKLAREHGQLGLIAVDYLQLMKGDDTRGGSAENRANEIAEISRGLKALAKELRCPVLALSQLNRGVESRPNKRPMMSDLRESGAIEQDADVILFLYRDEYYNPQSPDKGVAEVIVAKQRNGPIGTVRLGYRGDNTRFVNQ